MSFTRGFDEYDENRRDPTSQQLSTPGNDKEAVAPCYQFTLKHQHSIKNNPLCGICFWPWIHLVRSRWHDIHWKVYWPRLAFITFMSLLNSGLALVEQIRYGRAIGRTPVHDAPVFIIGHPRTGTTLLHGLLALDKERFAYCNTFCAGFANCFLWFEYIGSILFRNLIDDQRPMDNVKLSFDLPQEDELATTVLTGGISGYMPLYFMRQEPYFRPYYAFEQEEDDDDDEDNGSLRSMDLHEIASARTTWIDAFLMLLQKLSLRDGRGTKPLLLKSPVHTARIRLLLSLFPNAKFIYCHRNPYDVFRSACHLADTTYWYTYLNVPTNEQIQEFILRQYEILWYRYEHDRVLLKLNDNDSLIEVPYDELVNRPVEMVEGIYTKFGWADDFSRYMKDRIVQETATVASFPRNQHAELSPALERLVEDRWGASFERLGYRKKAKRDVLTNNNKKTV